VRWLLEGLAGEGGRPVKRKVVRLLLAALCLSAIGRVAHGQNFSIKLGPEETVLTQAQRQALGFTFGPPDGYLGVLERKGTYTFFVPAQSNGSCSTTPNTQGTYRLGGSLSQFTSAYGCAAALEKGADPNGYSFDHDYSGGGPVAKVSSGGHHGLLMVYHGEWHPGPLCNSVPWFYGSLGMAFSRDQGATFSSMGEIVQPYPTRTEGLGTAANCANVHVGYGTLVIADDNGNPIPDLRTFDPDRVYYYVFYNDYDPSLPAPCNQGRYCIAVARAQRSAVIAAAFAGNTAAFPSLFKKYYAGSFSQPATGEDPNNATNSGHYTPIFPQAASQPTVIYDKAINQFLLAYQVGFELYIQASPNLLTWSGTPLPNGFVSDMPNLIGYITLVGGGSHPATADLDPYLFYLVAASPSFPNWQSASTVYVSRRIHIKIQP
jgi:hypothetical protein